MGAALAWEAVLRAGVSHTLSQRGCRGGWSVANHRGLVRLNLSASAPGGRRRQLLLPIPWEPDQVDTIRDAVLTLFEALREGVELQEALERIPAVNDRRTRAGVSRPDGSAAPTQWGRATLRAPQAPRTWPALVESYREHKFRSGEVKPATWQRMYRPRMDLLLRLLAGDAVGAPADATALFQAIAAQWAAQPGCRTRQLQVQYTAAMLRWLLQQGQVGEEWSPPPDLAPFIGRSRQLRTITIPMAVEHILAMVEAIPDVRWRLCCQLIAAYGLRPEEIQHWGSPDFVDTDQGFTPLRVGAAMNAARNRLG